ncbi:piriformospora indica-insensitive protein 2-like protein [Carex littledalei]|uniref:Piriformospora indica-insensitive protein 2-like protein n=1 Tax=Carex littledalei TaxID=544730 RepID=A0A833QPY1_9POAL|nr:piriformospora indica-insensitive protein 2-like protein [Carex littledalei]
METLHHFLFLSLLCLSLAMQPPMVKPSELDGASNMANEELLALFEVMGDLLEDSTWVDMHPHPCTDTPWPGIQCELVPGDALLHVTKLHVGPDVAGIPACKSNAKLSLSLVKLPHLKTLSLFSCFLKPQNVSLSSSLFTNASVLEQLVLMSNPGLTGDIPSSLSHLTRLRVLSLSQNSLHGSIQKELGQLVELQQLDLSYNFLTGEIPPEIGGLTSLTILDLSWNQLTGSVPFSLGQMSSLQKLDLSFNKLGGNVPQDLGHLEKLVLLDLSHNSISGPIPGTLSQLRNLQYFLIENNPIGTNIPTFVGALKKLLVLGLSGCGLSGPVPDSFGSLSNLTALSLDRNSLNGSIPSSLSALPHLGQLNLSQNHLVGEISLSSEFITRLGKRLDVRDNKELCIDQRRYRNLSYYLEAPACVDSPKATNKTWADQNGTETGTSDSGIQTSDSEKRRVIMAHFVASDSCSLRFCFAFFMIFMYY